MIHSWDKQHKLDWNTICLGANEILGWPTPPTRQALNNKVTIKKAYQAKKNALRKELERVNNLPRPKTIKDGAERIAKLEKKIEELKSLNSMYADMFRTMVHNADVKKITYAELMAPLPSTKEPAKKSR
jgi:lysophospholipase L1-like esterase